MLARLADNMAERTDIRVKAETVRVYFKEANIVSIIGAIPKKLSVYT